MTKNESNLKIQVDNDDFFLDDTNSQASSIQRQNPQRCDLYGSILLTLGLATLPASLAAVILYTIKPSNPAPLIKLLFTLGQFSFTGIPILTLLVAIPLFIKLCCCSNNEKEKTDKLPERRTEQQTVVNHRPLP
jgi:hypothetical protein